VAEITRASAEVNLRPVTQLEARKFVAAHHRHSSAPLRVIAAVGVEADGELVGVGTLERPKAAKLCDGFTVEASRVCTTGTRNACSMIYGALSRAAKALGYRRIVTYTLSTEDGASCRAAGFAKSADVPMRSWAKEHHRRGTFQPSMFWQKYGEPAARVRWEINFAHVRGSGAL
jgi:L-amino acid N-acyltransferase YncA